MKLTDHAYLLCTKMDENPHLMANRLGKLLLISDV